MSTKSKHWLIVVTLTSNRMREFAASGSPTGLRGSNPISPRIKQTGS